MGSVYLLARRRRHPGPLCKHTDAWHTFPSQSYFWLDICRDTSSSNSPEKGSDVIESAYVKVHKSAHASVISLEGTPC